MITVGLSGGIGSGKTLIAHIFATLGISVFYADEAVKALYDADTGLRHTLIDLLGGDIYKDGHLQRKRMASLIFANDTLMQKVNALTHPKVMLQFEQWAQQQPSPYVVLEAAILFESGSDKKMDYTIAVTAPEPLRITRAMQRDNATEQEVKNRMKQQWNDEQRNGKANFIIMNDNEQAVLPQVITVHQHILKTL
ncbi:MAG: dephospho-CoA kinase [Prevotellaceae bacterium]|jgi:dephospho-CoA kinase|nr:dephospho-CoA kinase [Prevotellaceae bacterium]